jgi:HAE1 family hydrophobic/amphiphilic exporter-1
VAVSGLLVRNAVMAMLLLVLIAGLTGFLGSRLPAGFVPEEDQGYMSLNVQLPAAASVQRTAAVCDQIDAVLKATPGVKDYTVVIGATTTNTALYFLTLDSWQERDPRGRTADAIMAELNRRLAELPDARAARSAPTTRARSSRARTRSAARTRPPRRPPWPISLGGRCSATRRCRP